jgi:hypothetical protein
MKTALHVSREELEQLAREYHRVREEHRRAAPGTRARRRLGATLDRLQRRFDRLLTATGADAGTREHWHEHLWHDAPEPSFPGATAPLVFAGRSADGTRLRLLMRPDGDLDAIVDGTLTSRVEADEELTRTAPGLVFELDGVAFTERFATPPDARAELRAAIEASEPPPERLLSTLLTDGLLDRQLGLTPRGRRALRLDAEPARHRAALQATLSVARRGPVSAHAQERLEAVLIAAAALAPRAPLHLRGSLTHEQDPALERPVVAKATVDMGTRVVRAHVAAPTEAEALDLVEARLRQRLQELGSRDTARRREGGAAEPGEWRHQDLPTARPPFFDRPAAEREIVRRKTYAAEPMTPEEAAWELGLLDHDFHLFRDLSSGEDALVFADPDGNLHLERAGGGTGAHVDAFDLDPEPAPALSETDAVRRLNAASEPFVFFVDESSGRGAVLYRRYDGHYGLVTTR